MARSLALALGAVLALPRAAGVAVHSGPAEDAAQARLWLSPSGEKRTVVFVAGIEGAGHHFIHALIDAAVTFHQRNVSRVLLPSSWRCGEEWREESRYELKRTLSALPLGKVYLLDDIRSYPECGILKGYIEHQARRDLYHPHLDWIRMAADAAGAELRVLFLHREMSDCLAADCIHRRIESCSDEAETLKQNAIFLARDLRGLDPSTVACFDYGKMDSMIQALRDTFGEGVLTESLIKEVWNEGRGDEDAQLLRDRWSSTVSSIKLGSGALKGLCHQYRQLGVGGLAKLFDSGTASGGAVALQRRA